MWLKQKGKGVQKVRKRRLDKKKRGKEVEEYTQSRGVLLLMRCFWLQRAWSQFIKDSS